MAGRWDRVLLVVAELVYQVTWRAWMKLARRSLVGDLLARLRAAEERAVRGRMRAPADAVGEDRFRLPAALSEARPV